MHELLSHISCSVLLAQLLYTYGHEEEDRDGYGGRVALAGEAGHVQALALVMAR